MSQAGGSEPADRHRRVRCPQLLIRVEPLCGHGLTAARAQLRDWLTARNVPEPDLHDVLIAAGEAATNAYEHSGAAEIGSSRCPVWIEAQIDAHQVRVLVGDRGRWKQPDPVRSAGRGRGRLLMSGLVDSVQLRTGPHGTVVELHKNLGPNRHQALPTTPPPGPAPRGSASAERTRGDQPLPAPRKPPAPDAPAGT